MITVYEWAPDGRPVPGTAREIECSPRALGNAALRGYFAAEDGLRRPPTKADLAKRERDARIEAEARAAVADDDLPF
jgi:hypothetical protein